MTRFALRDLRLRPGQEHHDVLGVDLEPFVLGAERYVPVPSSPSAEITVARAVSGDMLRLRLATRLHGPCMRCLGDAAVDLVVDGTEYHDADADDEELRSSYVVDDQLHLSSWARDLIAEALPEQIVCRPGCRGLCGVCGRDLNTDPHEHDDAPADPRWAALEPLRGDASRIRASEEAESPRRPLS